MFSIFESPKSARNLFRSASSEGIMKKLIARKALKKGVFLYADCPIPEEIRFMAGRYSSTPRSIAKKARCSIIKKFFKTIQNVIAKA